MQVGKPLTLRLSVSGAGNVSKAVLPTPAFSDSFKAYDPETKSEQRFEQGLLSGHVTRDHLFVPLGSGQLVIPALVFNSFDPKTGAYREQKAGPFAVSVSGESAANSAAASAAKPATDGSGRGFHPLRYASELRDDRPRLRSVRWVWAGTGTTALAGLTVLARRTRRKTRSGEEVAKGARLKAQKALRRLRAGKDPALEIYGQVHRVLREYLVERFAISLGTQREGLRIGLQATGCDERAVEALLSELDNCDFARFAPGGERTSEVEATIERVVEVLAALDRPSKGASV
jgi:hypothetical protein